MQVMDGFISGKGISMLKLADLAPPKARDLSSGLKMAEVRRQATSVLK